MNITKLSFFLLSICLIFSSCTDDAGLGVEDYDSNNGFFQVNNQQYNIDEAFFINENQEVSNGIYKCRLELYNGDVSFSASQNSVVYNDIDGINSVVFELHTSDNDILSVGEYATTNLDFTDFQVVAVTTAFDVFGEGNVNFSQANAILDVNSADVNSMNISFDFIDDDTQESVNGSYTGQYEYFIIN